MSVSLGANGASYNYPQENDPSGWGDDATDWASAVSAALSNIGLGASVTADAVVNIISNSKGILIPRMTTTQRNAIGSPSNSLLIYNTTTTQYEFYTGSTWQSLASYINGTLTVTGATSLQSTLNVTGGSTFANVTINGNETVNGILTVTGNSVLASVTGGSTTLGSLTVTGATSLQSVTSTGSTVNGILSVTGNTTLVNVTGASITATGTILAASGTSGTPGISFSGDTDTGIWNSAANQISFSTGGSERFRIESTGQIKAVYESTLGTDYNTTLDNGYLCRAWVNFDGTSSNLTGTYSRTGTTITVSITSHGLTTGQSVYLDFTSGTGTDGIYIVTVVNANSYTVTDSVSGSTSGNVTQFRYIRASGNVSSITDNGTGDYTVNFTTSMPDANYSAVASNIGDSSVGYIVLISGRGVSNSVSSFRINSRNTSSNTDIDSNSISVAVFR